MASILPVPQDLVTLRSSGDNELFMARTMFDRLLQMLRLPELWTTSLTPGSYQFDVDSTPLVARELDDLNAYEALTRVFRTICDTNMTASTTGLTKNKYSKLDVVFAGDKSNMDGGDNGEQQGLGGRATIPVAKVWEPYFLHIKTKDTTYWFNKLLAQRQRIAEDIMAYCPHAFFSNSRVRTLVLLLLPRDRITSALNNLDLDMPDDWAFLALIQFFEDVQDIVDRDFVEFMKAFALLVKVLQDLEDSLELVQYGSRGQDSANSARDQDGRTQAIVQQPEPKIARSEREHVGPSHLSSTKNDTTKVGSMMNENRAGWPQNMKDIDQDRRISNLDGNPPMSIVPIDFGRPEPFDREWMNAGALVTLPSSADFSNFSDSFDLSYLFDNERPLERLRTADPLSRQDVGPMKDKDATKGRGVKEGRP